MSEVVSLHVGGAGVGLASPLWRLYCNEQGCPGQVGSFFTAPTGHPRAIIVDMDQHSIDQFRTTTEKELWSNLMYVGGKEDAASLFSNGKNSDEAQSVSMRTAHAIRSLAERCDNLQGFMVHNALGGGTGGGLTSLIIDKISIEYTKRPIMQFSLFPSDNTYGSVVEPYNVVLSLSLGGDGRRCCLLVDNTSLNRVLTNRARIARPTLDNANWLWAASIGSVTCNMRLDGQPRLRLGDLLTTLVPYPDLRYCTMNYGPVGQEAGSSAASLITTCLHPDMQMLDLDVSSGRFAAGALFLRGSLAAGEYSAELGRLISTGAVRWAGWSSACCRVYACDVKPATVVSSSLGSPTETLGSVLTTTAFSSLWARTLNHYRLMLARRAFIHWYLMCGMEMDQFIEAGDKMANIVDRYRELDAS